MSELNLMTSLMDLADFDTSDVKVLTSRLQDAGIYLTDLKSVEITEQPAQDPADPTNYQILFKHEILEFTPESRDYTGDPEDMVGREMTERYFLYGKELQQAIGLLMGRYKNAGYEHKGRIGGLPNTEPGWLDGAVGTRNYVRVKHSTSKDGNERARFDWLSKKQIEKAKLEVGILGREMLEFDNKAA